MSNLDKRKLLAIIGFLLILAFAGGVKYAGMSKAAGKTGDILLDQPAAVAESSDQEEDAEREIEVYVTGEVEKPGVYQMKTGDRVHDALNLAEPGEDANLKMINLARKLQDEEAIVVPSVYDTDAAAAGQIPGTSLADSAGIAAASAKTQGKININTASAQVLDEELPGIGPALAERIVDYRSSNGGFKKIEDLMDVSGIGEKRFEDLKDVISVR